MLFILLRATRPAYADLPNERNTLNPGSETLCGRAPPLWGKPFLVAFWSFLSRGPAFVLNPSGLRGLDSARGAWLRGVWWHQSLCRNTGHTYGFVTTCPPLCHPPLSRCSSAPGVQERVRNGFLERVAPGLPITPLGETKGPWPLSQIAHEQKNRYP